MAGDLGKATFALEADTAQFKRGLDQAQGMAQSGTAKIGQNFQRMGAGMTQAGRGLTMGLTAPILGIGFVAAKSFGDFDAAMTQSLAIMGDVSDAMRTEMAQAARDVALRTTFSAEQAAEAYFYLASAGLSAQQSLAAMPSVATFAQAGMFDMALATDLATDAQSALGMRSEDTTQDLANLVRVTDVLVKANTLANATVEQFARALTAKGASALKAANKEIEEGVGLLAYWADQGLKGEAAGTALSGVLTMLPKLAVKNTEAFAEYGVEIFTSTGEMKTFSEIAGEFAPILENMTTAERAMAYQQMGINRLMVDAINKMKGGEEAIAGYTEGLYEAGGITQEVADKQLQTFNAQMSLLKSQVQDVFITLGTALVPVLMDVVKGLKPVIGILKKGAELFGKLPKPIKIAVFALLLLLAAIGPLLMMAGLLVSAIGSLLIFLPMIAPMILPIVGGFIGLLPVIGLVIAVLALLGFAIAAIIVNFSDIKKAVRTALQGLGDLVKGAIKLGGKLIVGVAKGVAAAAGALYRVVGAVVSNVVSMLNPFKWVFGSFIVGTYEKAGREAGAGLAQQLHLKAVQAKKQTTEDLQPETGEIADEFEAAGEIAGEAISTGIVSAVADAGLVAAIGRAIEAGGGLGEAVRKPLEAMRNMVADIRSELDRLSGLPTIESAAEDLERAELALEQLQFKEQMEQGEKRIEQVDDEIKKLVDQRNMIVFMAKGRTAESDAIDKQIRSLGKEKKGLKKSVDASKKKHDAIQDEIDALDRLTDRRDLERDILAARAKASDKTLATDAEVIKQLGTMEGTVRDVTSELDAQTDQLWTQFLPAWEDVVEQLLEADAAAADVGEGAGGGVEDLAEGLGDLEGALEDFDIEEMIGEILPDPEKIIGEQVDKFKKTINKYLPVLGLAVVGLILAPFVGVPVLLGIAIGALLGFLWVEFHDEIINFFKQSAKKILGFVKKIWGTKIGKLILLAITGPFAPLVALATDAFGIRSALLGAGKKIIGFVKKHWKEIVTLISGPFMPLVALATDAFGIRSALLGAAEAIWKGITETFNSIVKWIKTNWASVIAEIILAPFFFLRVGVGDLWGVRTAMKNAFDAVVGFVTKAFTTIKDFIIDTLTALPAQIFNLALSIGTTVFDAIMQGFGLFTELGSLVIGALTSLVSEVPGWALSIGSAIFTNLMSGLGEIGQALWDKIPGPLQWVFEKLAAGVKIALDVDLPSPKSIAQSLDPTGILGQHGVWSVPGQGRQDSVPAKLTPGEMVLPRDSAQVLRDFFTGDTGDRGGGGGGDINVTVHNPQPEAAEDTVRRRLQALSQLGATR